jgi:hypothetical protein
MRIFSAIATCLVLLVSGCSVAPVMTTTSTPTNQVQGAALRGRVHGGNQPITGASVYLYAVGTGGYGTASTPLLKNPVMTDGNGNFSITGDYSCSPNQQVYIYTNGGNPGLASGTDNKAAGLLAGLGSCSALLAAGASFQNIFVNEVSTVATAYALAGFAVDATDISSSGSSLALQGVANAMAMIQNFEALSTGTALAATPNGAAYPPQSEVNTLANILAACINTTGSTASGMPCNTLFTNALSGGTTGSQPTDTATAAIYIAHNSAANPGNLFNLQATSPPFLPDLGAAPNDFSMQIIFTSTNGYGQFNDVAIDGSGNAWFVGGWGTAGDGIGEVLANTLAWSASTPITGGGLSAGLVNSGGVDIAIDPSENVWIPVNPDINGAALVEVSSSGSVLSGSAGYSTSQLGDLGTIAVDGSGNVWLPSLDAVVWEYIPGTGWANTTGFGGGYLDNPVQPAVDTSGNIWIPNHNSGTLAEFNSSGTPLCPTTSCYSGGGLYAPVATAIDPSGNIWIANNGLGPALVSEFSSSGMELSGSGYTGGGLTNPQGIAIDGAGNVFVANSPGSNAISEFNSSGAALSGPNGFGANTNSAPNAVAIDGSGNVWTADPGSGAYICVFIGLAAPTVTPLSANLAAPYGKHAVNMP